MEVFLRVLNFTLLLQFLLCINLGRIANGQEDSVTTAEGETVGELSCHEKLRRSMGYSASSSMTEGRSIGENCRDLCQGTLGPTPNGDFPHPGDCRQFIRCTEWSAEAWMCPPFNYFDNNEMKCAVAESDPAKQQEQCRIRKFLKGSVTITTSPDVILANETVSDEISTETAETTPTTIATEILTETSTEMSTETSTETTTEMQISTETSLATSTETSTESSTEITDIFTEPLLSPVTTDTTITASTLNNLETPDQTSTRATTTTVRLPMSTASIITDSTTAQVVVSTASSDIDGAVVFVVSDTKGSTLADITTPKPEQEVVAWPPRRPLYLPGTLYRLRSTPLKHKG